MKRNTFFPRIQVKTKKRSSQEMEHFFPQFQVQTCDQMDPRVKLLEGLQVKTIFKLFGGIQSNYWGEYIPHSPRVSAPLVTLVESFNQAKISQSMAVGAAT